MTRPPIPADRRVHEQIKIFKNKGRRGGGRNEQIRETVQPETEHCTGEKPAVPESGKQREVGSGDVYLIKHDVFPQGTTLEVVAAFLKQDHKEVKRKT